jgi:2-oxoglutarate ferredoxin oxidoreductase subunit alpha
MRDVIRDAERQGRRINYLHFDYVFPIKTERVKQFFKDNDKVCLIEGNIFGQLGDLITNKTGLQFHKKFLRYNGRTFYKEEILNFEL